MHQMVGSKWKQEILSERIRNVALTIILRPVTEELQVWSAKTRNQLSRRMCFSG